jgi:DNA primase
MVELIPQDRIDELRARYRVSDVAARRTKLRRYGGEFKGLCPFHSERTPSFTVNDVKGYAHCFGCGWHGDIIRFVQETERLSFRDAVAAIDGAGLPPVDPAWLAKAKQLDDDRNRESVEAAERFWDGGGDIGETPAAFYLARRLIHVAPPALRFGVIPSWRDDDGAWHNPRPALMLRAESLSGDFMGIQRIFLTWDGQKASMAKPKLSLGNIHGASIRFGRPASDAILTGGPEDGLTLFQSHNEMVTVYVSCGETMMPFVKLPRLCRSVTIARQNDAPGVAAAKRTRAEMEEQRRRVRDIAPDPAFKDWNDELRGIRRKAAA